MKNNRFNIERNRPGKTKKQTAACTALVFMFSIIFTGVMVWGVWSVNNNTEELWTNRAMTAQEYSEQVKERELRSLVYDAEYELEHGKKF